jgi:hypothetical protein
VTDPVDSPDGPGAPSVSRWRPLLREDRQIAALWGVLAVSSLLLRPLWLALAPALPPCPFRALTGIPCLSCGTTRAALAVLHGDIVNALAINPLATLAGAGFIVGGLAAPMWTSLSLPLPRIAAPPPRALRIALVAALLLDWAWVIASQ